MIGALSSTTFACRVARRLCMLANAQLMFKFSNGKPEPLPAWSPKLQQAVLHEVLLCHAAGSELCLCTSTIVTQPTVTVVPSASDCCAITAVDKPSERAAGAACTWIRNSLSGDQGQSCTL